MEHRSFQRRLAADADARGSIDALHPDGTSGALLDGARELAIIRPFGKKHPRASWRNWQTRWIQNPVPLRAYRFDSDRGHFTSLRRPVHDRFPGDRAPREAVKCAHSIREFRARGEPA